MKKQLNLKDHAWKTTSYEQDPFQLGEIDETQLKIVKDFLPRPEELVFRDSKPDSRKVTVVLDDYTIDFFKKTAKELGGSYQAMIRKLLLEYARTIKRENKNPTQTEQSAENTQ